jgi:hypothetical protein
MEKEIPKDDPELTKEQLNLVATLSDAQIQEIDRVILENTKEQWRKVAMVVAITMSSLQNRFVGVPDVFYAQRVANLVNEGVLLSQGNLKRMRFSEVKLA